MLAFGWNFHFGHLDYNFHDGRVVIPVCVRGTRFRFVGGLGAPPRRLVTVESGGGGGGIDAAWPPFYIEQCVREAKVRAAKAAATAETAKAKKQRRAESRSRAASEANAARFQARRRRGIRRLREKLRRKGALSATKEAELAALERELTEVSRADVGVEDGRAVFSGSGTPLGGAFNGRDAALEDVDPAAGGGGGRLRRQRDRRGPTYRGIACESSERLGDPSAARRRWRKRAREEERPPRGCRSGGEDERPRTALRSRCE